MVRRRQKLLHKISIPHEQRTASPGGLWQNLWEYRVDFAAANSVGQYAWLSDGVQCVIYVSCCCDCRQPTIFRATLLRNAELDMVAVGTWTFDPLPNSFDGRRRHHTHSMRVYSDDAGVGFIEDVHDNDILKIDFCFIPTSDWPARGIEESGDEAHGERCSSDLNKGELKINLWHWGPVDRTKAATGFVCADGTSNHPIHVFDIPSRFNPLPVVIIPLIFFATKQLDSSRISLTCYKMSGAECACIEVGDAANTAFDQVESAVLAALGQLPAEASVHFLLPSGVRIQTKQRSESIAILFGFGDDSDEAAPGSTSDIDGCIQALIAAYQRPVQDDGKFGIFGSTLHKAAYEDNAAGVALCCARGDDLETRNSTYSHTPLHIASSRGHLEVVRLLLAAQADHLAEDKDHLTPLQIAKMMQRSEEVEALLEHMVCELNETELSKDEHGTALHRAAFAGDVAQVSSLCARSADVNAMNPSYGQSPFHVACAKGELLVMRVLLAAKADPEAKDQDGYTPLDLLKSDVG